MSHQQNSISWMNKGDWATNAARVNEFYKEVLKAFIVQLEIEVRYKGLISDEQMDEIQRRVKEKLQKPEGFLEKCLSMKQGSYKPEVEIKNEPNPQRELPELKEEHIDDKDEYLFVDSLKKKQERGKDQKQDEIDDLQLFQDLGHQDNLILKPLKSEVEVKKEDNSQDYIQNKPAETQKEIKNEEESEPNQDDGDALTVDQCLQNLGTILLATFSAQTLRHKPKQQKITVSLDNSFLKSPYNEVFVGTVPIEITKVEKSDIRKDIHANQKANKKK